MRGRAERKGPAALGPMIDRVRSLPSTPLPESTRREVEAATSTDLSGVRVHRTPEAARYAEALGARAFTFDRDIVVGDGAGETTIAHEAAHAAQFARRGAPSAPVGVAGPGHAAHAEATAAAHGGATAAASPGGLVQRDETGPAPRPRRLTADELRRAGSDLLEHLALLGEWDPGQLVAFLDANDALMSTLLGRYGYRGCYVNEANTLYGFRTAYEKWFAKEGLHAQFENPVMLFNDPLYAKIREREQNQLVWGVLPDGSGYMGTRRDLKAAVDDWHVRRTLQTGQNITGGLFGAIGYGLGGDTGSDLGSSFDGLLMAAGSTAEARNQMRDVGAALPRRQEQAEVRPAEPSPRGPVDPPAQRSTGPTSPARPPVVEPAPPPRMPSVGPAPAPTPTRSEVDPMTVAPPAAKPKATRNQAPPTPPKATGKGAPPARKRLKDLDAGERARVEELRKGAEVEADAVRKAGQRSADGIPPGWDHAKHPYGPKRGWLPGDPVNMPDGAGNHPSWDTIRERVWRTKAIDEVAARAAGTSRPEERVVHLDPIKELTATELADVAKSGKMPKRVGAEIEHRRIPQRMGRLLEAAGLSRDQARDLTKLGDPSNLEPTHREWHAVVDARAREINPNRNRSADLSLDERVEFPLGSATNEELSAIVDRVRERKVDLGATPAGRDLREILRVEKDRRGASARWMVP